jgi:hypothetical protein
MDQKLVCSIQFQTLLVLLDLLNSTFQSEAKKTMAIKHILVSDHSE